MSDQAAKFRAAIGGATLLMLAISWPLWVGSDDFPRVPFVRGMPEVPARLSWAIFLALLGSIGIATVGVGPRATLGVAIGILAFLILGDQHRFQPWAYQFMMAALAMATTTRSAATGLARLFLIALYVHSGLSKCDESFYRWMGPSLLRAGLHRFGIEPRAWPPIALELAVRLMPAAEIAVGLGLALRRTRRPALVGAVAMHLALLWILGPFGLGHSTIVLIWNAALIVEDLVLFGPSTAPAAGPEASTRLAPLTRSAFLMAAILPLGERAGLFDVWPSFALYASHPGRTRVSIRSNGAILSKSLRDELGQPADPDVPRPLNLNNWSLRVRRTPIYPQPRAANGLAEAVAARYPEALVSVSQIGPAGAREQRRSEELVGRDAIRAFGDRFWINAHPAGRPWCGTGNAHDPGADR